jgi:hypothetical protein
MRRLLIASLCASVLSSGALARGDDKAECLEASSKGQTARDAHQLLEAREQFRLCARQQCPAVVQRDCAGWLDGVEKDLPSVILRARDGAGADLVDVRVTVDGAPLATRLDGQAIPMNPGMHAFHFELADGTSAEARVVVAEGSQNQLVTTTLGGPGPQLPATPARSAATVPPAPGGASPWRTLGWVLSGVGVVGLGVGAGFGVAAMSDKGSANCAGKVCDAGPLASARNAATAANVGLAVGGVLAGAGLALVLFSPGSRSEAATAIRVAPAVATNGGGLVVGGAW